MKYSPPLVDPNTFKMGNQCACAFLHLPNDFETVDPKVTYILEIFDLEQNNSLSIFLGETLLKKSSGVELQSDSRPAGWQTDWLADWLTGCLALAGWPAGWLADWLDGWLAGWPAAGWLAG